MPTMRPTRRRRVPLTAHDRARLADERRHRAREELLDIHPREEGPVPVVEVANPLRGTRYRVYLPAYPELEPMACECTDFAHRNVGTCKHMEAVRLWLAAPGTERPAWEAVRDEKGAASLWKEIDARIARLPRDERGASQRYRAPGAALVESPLSTN